jgi:hypothetical protein
MTQGKGKQIKGFIINFYYSHYFYFLVVTEKTLKIYNELSKYRVVKHGSQVYFLYINANLISFFVIGLS